VLPAILRKKDWGLKFISPGGEKFQLGPRGEHKVIFNIILGSPFNTSELKQTGEDIDIQTMIDGLIIGGMTYRIDPKTKENLPERPHGVDGGPSCKQPSEKLLSCLGLPSDGVKLAKLRKVTIDILYKDEDC
jgi:hypothetical protein